MSTSTFAKILRHDLRKLTNEGMEFGKQREKIRELVLSRIESRWLVDRAQDITDHRADKSLGNAPCRPLDKHGTFEAR
jgi:hypothetical protein